MYIISRGMLVVRLLWDETEAIILLEAYLKNKKGLCPLKDTISDVSTCLRNLAEQKGLVIDDRFRNENGIGFQLRLIEELYEKGAKTELSHKLFEDIIQCYKYSRDEYDIKLREVEVVLGTQHANSESFFEWLGHKVSARQLSDYYINYEVIDKFCTSKVKILEKPLLETVDLEIILKVKETIETNKMFRLKHRKNLYKYILSVNYYYDYIKVHSIGGKSEFVSDVINVTKPILESAPEVQEIKVDVISKEIAVETLEMVVDFNNIQNLAFSKPNSVIYFEETHENINSWTDAYVVFMKLIYEDYEDVIPVGKSFTTGYRVDFGGGELVKSMVAPKKVCDDMYVETNLSSVDIIGKIKALLDVCLVDYENVVIKYCSKKKEKKVSTVSSTPDIKICEINPQENVEDALKAWMLNSEHIPEPTCRGYISAIKRADVYAKTHGLKHNKLFVYDFKEFVAAYFELFECKDFVDLNNRNFGLFKISLLKLYKYLKECNTQGNKSACKAKLEKKKTLNKIDLTSYKTILQNKFPKGYRLESPLDLSKFKKSWLDLVSIDIKDIDEVIKSRIADSGIVYETKVYHPESMLSVELSEKVWNRIAEYFTSGKKACYYETLFEEFSDEFYNFTMYDDKMLKAYLTWSNKGRYFMDKTCIITSRNANINHADEVKKCMIEAGVPMLYDDIFKKLSYIPQNKIRNILLQNQEYISNGKNEQFHVDIAVFDENDWLNIEKLINLALVNNQFVGGNELIDMISKKYPDIIEQNSMLSKLGLRDLIAHEMKEKFSIKGNVISKKGASISMADVFADFCEQHAEFTIDDLRRLKCELNTTIYFEDVYDNSLRVSEDRFVSQDRAAFDIDKTDAAIDRFCVGDYMGIKHVDLFVSFPEAGFPWNSYLLEHYVAVYSKKYKLLHSSFNESSCVGAIVKKISGIDSFDDLIANALAVNGLPLNKESALQYMCDDGYLARRSYASIEQILIKAKELRNQKGNS